MSIDTYTDLFNPRFYSNAERDAAYVLDSGIVAGKFRIIEFEGQDTYNQYCFDVEGRKFRLSKSETGNRHSLAMPLAQKIRTPERVEQWDLFFFLKDQEYHYDNYYDSLIEPSDIIKRVSAALDDFPIAKKEILLVKGEYADCRPLLYCLQKRFRQVMVLPKYELKPISFKDSFMTPLAMNAQIEICPQASPSDYVDDWSPAICVPLIEPTLNSKFFGSLIWRDILPDNPALDFYLGEYPIKSVRIKFDYDGQDQIYVTVKYADGIEKRINTNKPRTASESDSETKQFTQPSVVKVTQVATLKPEHSWVNIAEVKSYYKKEDLEAMPSPALTVIKEEILNAYKQFDYIYTDTNVWVENKVVDKQGKRYILTPNLISIEQLTSMMPELGAIHYLHQYVYDEIEIMQRGIHKERFERNAEKRKEEFIANERQ